MKQIKTYSSIIQDFEQLQIPASKDLQLSINRQLLKAEINFQDWVILNNHIIQVKNEYLVAQNLHEQAYATLIYYKAK